VAPAPITEPDGHAITAEVQVAAPGFTGVGWPAQDSDEVRVDVQRLLGSLYPPRQITVNVGELTINDHRARWSSLASAIATAVYWADCYRPLGR
jgi:hypothetical protein